MKHEFNDTAFLNLSEESQEKVECIYEIANLLHRYYAPDLSPQEFDDLYDKPLKDLKLIAGYFMKREKMMSKQG
jgi:hypothetical protein